VHIVTPGENLTSIAGLYGITLEALLGVNELDDPDLIYPNQSINLPPVTSGQGS
jgi:LysM repeat protein